MGETTPTFCLHHSTLERASNIALFACGNFSGADKTEEVLLVRGVGLLELQRLDPTTGKFVLIHAVDSFGRIRALEPFRLLGSEKDYVVITADSGRLMVLEFVPTAASFVVLIAEPFGRSGIRLQVPGQYLAIEPFGRALLIAGLEKHKLAYVLNRDGSNKLTISSPLECHKSGTLTWSLIGIDTGVDNPMFAAIETAAGSPEKQLVFYELDLGLNHLVRKLVFSAPLSAHRLVAVPAGSTGPGGVLVLCESGLFVFRHPKNEAFEIRKTIPLRLGWSAPPPLVTCLTTSRQRTRFFFLVQTETGDLFKVTLDTSSSSSSPSTQVLRISYFDTLPRAVSLSVLKLSGVLLLAAEAGDHHVYQFRSLGSNDDTVSPFSPRPVAAPLQHLSLLDTWPSLAPLTTAKLLDFDTYMLTTATDPSTLRVLKRGWMSMPLGASALPAPPTGLWALPTSGCLLLSFQGSSRLLSTAGSALAEMPTANSGFEANQTTLDAFELADGTIIQTFVNGFVRLDLSRLTASSSSSSSSSTTTTTASLSSASTSSTLLFKWDCPSPGQQIRLSAHNSHQFLLTTQSHEQYLFEIDSTFHLSLFASASLPFLPSAVELFPIAKGLRRARFLVAADPNSLKVGLFAIEPAASFLQSPMTSIPVPDMPTSLAITLSLTTSELYYLHVGMSNGMLSRVPVDLLSGTPTGPAFPIIVQNGAAVRMRKVSPHHFFILGAQTKYCFNAVETFHQQPVPAYPGLSGVTAFVSPHCPQHGFAAVASHNLVMFVLKPDQSNFHTYSQQQLPSIPRQHIHTSNLIFHLFACSSASPIPEHPSQIVCVNLPQWSVSSKLMVAQDETIVSMSWWKQDEIFVVGTVSSLSFQGIKPSAAAGHLYCFSCDAATGVIILVHKTPVAGIPGAICPFLPAPDTGALRLLVGVDDALILFTMGKLQLLRKIGFQRFPSMIRYLSTIGSRIFVGDLAESISFLLFDELLKKFFLFASDTTPRWLTAMLPLDYNTVIAADKFGNVFALAIPEPISKHIDDDKSRAAAASKPFVLQLCAHFHLGQIVTFFHRASVAPGRDAVVYTTNLGAIGVLEPFSSRKDILFFQKLESSLRTHHSTLSGNTHLRHRSVFTPVCNVVDGDLCKVIFSLKGPQLKQIADDIEHSMAFINRKIFRLSF